MPQDAAAERKTALKTNHPRNITGTDALRVIVFGLPQGMNAGFRNNTRKNAISPLKVGQDEKTDV